MKYVRIYKGMETGWTTFDTMTARGLRAYVQLIPGTEVSQACKELISKLSARAEEFAHSEREFRKLAKVLRVLASNQFGYVIPKTIEIERMKKFLPHAVFFALNGFEDFPMGNYSKDELDKVMVSYYGLLILMMFINLSVPLSRVPVCWS